MSKITSVYSSRDYCIDEMARIRDMWGNRRTFTPAAIAGARTSLGFMMLYCPVSLRNSVEAMLYELGQREICLLLYGDRNPKDSKSCDREDLLCKSDVDDRGIV